jgi:Family of unknown function (DUF6176)
VRPEEIGALRAWLAGLMTRQDEVRETFRNEGVRHEQALLLAGADGPVLVYAIEVEDADRAHAAYASSRLPIDLEHREIMARVIEAPARAELLYDVRL